jgi:hypothetical protein
MKTNDIDRIIDNLAKEMADDIDQGIMMDMLTKDGWTQTKINPAFSEYSMMGKPFEDWYGRTAEWVHLNAKGDYKLLKGQWLFKDPKDATMFILRWS